MSKISAKGRYTQLMEWLKTFKASPVFKNKDSKDKKFNLQYQKLDEYYFEPSYTNKDEVGYYALGHIVNGSTRKATNPSRLYSITLDGRSYKPKNGWRMSEEDLKSLISQNRIHVPKGKGNLYRKLYKHESKGKPATNLWDDIHSISQGRELRKYPTAKPIKLLERLIQISTNESDWVYDPMCGSGTTAQAANNLNRKCIINDINTDIIDIVKSRFPTCDSNIH